MNAKTLLLFVFCSSISANTIYAQTEIFYTIENNDVQKEQFSDIVHELKFKTDDKNSAEAFTLGWAGLAAKLIPLLVDGASKLFYNPDNFNKEYFANYSFFDSSGYFKKINPDATLVLEQTGENDLGKRQLINRFEFELGVVKNVEGYHFLGLKAYNLPYSWSKLSSTENRMNYIIDISFYYFDDDDKAQEFHINPILLDAQVVGAQGKEIRNTNFQVIPKMKVLQNIQVRVREINAKTQNWNRYLELYQSNQDNISRFLIRAISK